MNELKEIFVGILVIVHGITFYIIGRTNFLEKVIIQKLNDLLERNEETDTTEKGGDNHD